MRLLAASLALALVPAAFAPTDALAQTRRTPARAAAAPALPAGTYALDPAHTSLDFSVRHLGISNVTGTFGQVAGTVTVGTGGLRTLSATTTAQVASIDTRNERRDGHLKSADFFDADNHPAVTFQSTGVRAVRGNRFQLVGTLTMRGTSRPVVLDAVYNGTVVQPAQMGGKRVIAFTATGRVNRQDFGIAYGPGMIGNDVRLTINAEAIQQ